MAARSQLLNNTLVVFEPLCKKCKYEIPTQRKLGA